MMKLTLQSLKPTNIIIALSSTFKRFPLATLYAVLLTIYLIYMLHGEHDLGKLETLIPLFLPTATMLNIATRLWGEEISNKTWRYVTGTIVQLLWLGICYYTIYLQFFSALGIFSLVLFGLVAMTISAFFRQPNDVPLWNFTVKLILAAASAAFVGIVLTAGINLLLLSLNKLFNINFSYKLYTDVYIICGILIAQLLFMQLIPSGKEKTDTQPQSFTNVGKGILHYLLIPLMAAYLLVLYAYAIQIIVKWTLPTGWVSTLVSVSMLAMVVLVAIIYPTQYSNGSKFDKLVLRWLPAVMMPLLVLMSIAIWRRLDDYGITLSRLYILVFNIWCYAVCIILILVRSRRIWWIPASFVLIFALCSVGPQSLANYNLRTLKAECIALMKSTGVKKFPLSEKEFDYWHDKQDKKIVAKVESKLYSLRSDYEWEAIEDVVDKNVNLYRYTYGPDTVVVDTIAAVKKLNYYYNNEYQPISIPQGYTSMLPFNDSYYIDTTVTKEEKITNTLSYTTSTGKNEKIDVPISISEIKKASDDDKPITIVGSHYMIYINNYSLSLGNTYTDEYSFDYSGVLFLK